MRRYCQTQERKEKVMLSNTRKKREGNVVKHKKLLESIARRKMAVERPEIGSVGIQLSL